jgi:hypothetical protein
MSHSKHRSRWLSSRTFRIAALLGLFAGGAAEATIYRWPLGNGSTPDEMNTSFGPRVNYSKWDFHDGADLPADCGTDVHAVAEGSVTSSGNAGGSWGSRHVVVKVTGSDVFVYYFHLQSIDGTATVGSTVTPGQVLGKVGKDDASYCHLHLEFRQGSSQQSSSRHPLHYLPYTDTANFTAPAGARFNRQGNGQMAARLVFGAASKLEGDLSRVEVELRNGSTLLATRRVDVDDKTTVNEGNDDDLEFLDDIALEGYQTSNMRDDKRTDLKYGVVVRNLPGNCDSLVAKVYDLGSHQATSAAISVPDQTAVELSLDFEDGLTTPPGWVARTSANSQNVQVTSVANDATVAHTGTHSLLATDDSTRNSSEQAAIESGLGSDRFEWRAEGWIRPSTLDLPEEAKQVYLLEFLDAAGADLSVSARLRNTSGSILAGIAARKPDGSTGAKDSAEVIGTASWHKWTLRLLRVATRETTAVLLLDDIEKVRYSWDSTVYEPLKVRLGVGQSFSKVKAVLNTDDVLITERTM